jgi:glycosyltransferase involved in cell wall biosynthesis
MGEPHMDMKGATSASPSRRRLLSVIIPAYNAADTLGVQLDALKAQDYNGDWEIVVVNNGSTDNTAKVVQDYQRLMPHLRLVHGLAKQNPSYARNTDAQAARGDAFLFCDADDVVAPGWVSALAEALEKHDVVFGAIEMQTLNQYTRPNLYGRNAKVLFLDFLPRAVGCNFAISREAFEAVGGFSQDFPRGQDVDISWRLQLRGYSLHDAPAAVVYYRDRTTLLAIWKQGVSNGQAYVNLYRHFAAYMACRALQCERP